MLSPWRNMYASARSRHSPLDGTPQMRQDDAPGGGHPPPLGAFLKTQGRQFSPAFCSVPCHLPSRCTFNPCSSLGVAHQAGGHDCEPSPPPPPRSFDLLTNFTAGLTDRLKRAAVGSAAGPPPPPTGAVQKAGAQRGAPPTPAAQICVGPVCVPLHLLLPFLLALGGFEQPLVGRLLE